MLCDFCMIPSREWEGAGIIPTYQENLAVFLLWYEPWKTWANVCEYHAGFFEPHRMHVINNKEN